MNHVPLPPGETIRRIGSLRFRIQNLSESPCAWSDRVTRRSINAMMKELHFHETVRREREENGGFSATAHEAKVNDDFRNLCRGMVKATKI